MAITNIERVGKAMELLKDGLAPYIKREFDSHFKAEAENEARRFLNDDKKATGGPMESWDVAASLRLMWESWNVVFKDTLGHAERSYVSELRNARIAWAHQKGFTGDDADRTLDTVERLLTAVAASAQADEVRKMKQELRRVIFDEQARTEKRKSASVAVESTATGALKPWREVVTPHADVASGQYQQAEFAADLWQVYVGGGADEYRNPVEFFNRTFLTESLRKLLVGGVRRLNGKGGDPVIQLQTNFGGGKTHSMLALYHLCSGIDLMELTGVDGILKNAGVDSVPKIKRVVLVGNRISAGNPIVKPDGCVIRTLWGEMAWQLGGRKAFERIQADDERATSPGDAIRELMNEYGPCLILIDEWVAYARQLHDAPDLPGGSFETHFTFAQALTESAKAAKQCLLVVSLPASDTKGSPHAIADDVEVGGERGRAALDRLRNAVGRVEASWRPASAEESFEIVRRRLFEPMIEQEQFTARDVVAKAFLDLYRTQHQEFPPECKESDYEKRIKAAYPIHPEIFDRLYDDWSSLVKFQRTRGVLRLMAAVIHSLWEKGDKNPLIMPGNIPLDDSRVLSELSRYLSDNWVPVIEKDVDGPNALPLAMDSQNSNLGKYSACRRVARTIYLGSAPTANAANQGLEDRRVKLGCVMPGESPSVFGDAMRRMGAVATYLYQDGARYWYSTQPTVTKLAEDRSEQFRRDPDAVGHEIDRRIREDLKKRGEFSKIAPMPMSGAEVADELETRLVVLGVSNAYSKQAGNSAEAAAKTIYENRGTGPRIFRNTLVFLACDQARLQDLDEAVRKYLAWDSILRDKETPLDLTPHQVKQATVQKDSADKTVIARIPEAYQWLLVPTQQTPQHPIEWQSLRLIGTESMAIRASKRLGKDDLMVAQLASTSLKLELDKVLWRSNDHVAIGQLIEDFARYSYLQRLITPQVLLNAISEGLGLLSWSSDTFAYAESYDETAKRYRGLRCGQRVTISMGDKGLLVKPEAALRQVEAEQKPTTPIQPVPGEEPPVPPIPGKPDEPPPTPKPRSVSPKRFHSSATLNPTRVNRDTDQIVNEILHHLALLPGAKVTVHLDIEADIPEGIPEDKVRTIGENCRTLNIRFGFEEE